MTKPPEARDLEALRQIMADLRTPKTGCPWDLAQTFSTIAPYTIEEAYEVADAIERNDLEDLKGELGDLLLQVVYHSQIAAEQNAFALDDVVGAICDKMIRRHPHVYGAEDHGDAPKMAKGFWERQKAEERQQRRVARGHDEQRDTENAELDAAPERLSEPSVLADVPRALPALSRATKLQGRAARVGFDWPDSKPVLAKISEEIAELAEAIEGKESPHRLQDELGDIFFALANLGRHLGVDSEAALSSTNAKFTSRFTYIEQRLADNGSSPEASTLEEMDALWNEAKLTE